MDQAMTGTATPANSFDVGAWLRRRGRLIVLGLVVGLLGALAFTANQTPRYTSSSFVLVQPTETSSGGSSGARSDSEVNVNTESVLVRDDLVAGAAKKLLNTTESTAALAENVSVTVPPNSQVLEITFLASSAKAAQAGAQAFAQAYLAQRAGKAKAEVAASAKILKAQLGDSQEQLQIASDKAAALPNDSPDRVYAEAQRAILINQITALQNRLSALQAAATNGGEIIRAATLPLQPSYPIPLFNAGAGALIGLLLGLAVAMLVDRADHRINSRSDVARRLDVPVLAEVPGRRIKQADLLLAPVQAAIVDRLRQTLTWHTPDLQVVQVSDTGGRGASGPLALALSQSWAQAAGTATLVLANPQSVLPAGLNLHDRPGLMEVLRGDVRLEEVAYRVPGTTGLIVIPSGRATGDFERLMQSPGLASLVAQLRAAAGPVVFESAGTDESAAAQALAIESDVVLLVVERGAADDRVVRRAALGASELGATVGGIVLTPRLEHSSTRGTTPTVDPRPPMEQQSALPSSHPAMEPRRLPVASSSSHAAGDHRPLDR